MGKKKRETMGNWGSDRGLGNGRSGEADHRKKLSFFTNKVSRLRVILVHRTAKKSCPPCTRPCHPWLGSLAGAWLMMS
jgi:hypothetical protein